MRETWVDSSYAGSPLESVLVVGPGDEVRRRRLFEQDLTSRLETRGVAAVASSGVTQAAEGRDREAVRKTARELGIQSILVTQLLRVDRQRRYVSGQPMRYYGYFDPATGREYSPGTWDEVEILRMEIKLYDVATGTLIWSAASQSLGPPSDEKLVRSLSKEIIGDLTKRGLLKR